MKDIKLTRLYQLQVARDYVSRLGGGVDFGPRMSRIRDLKSISYNNVEPVFDNLVQDLDVLFKLPKVQVLPHSDQVLNKNELLAAFIHFLLQMQRPNYYGEPKFINSHLMEELRSLIAIFGDTPFQATEDEQQVQNLLAELEGLANEAGRLVHSYIFVPHLSDEIMEASLVVLLESIDSFKGNIRKFLYLLPSIPTSKPKCLVDSLFIVDSLLCDLKGLMDRDDDEIVGIKDRIKMLHQELMLAQPLIKDITQHHLEIEMLKEPTMGIRGIAYEAEYLINSFLVGVVPLWYLTIRLNHFIYNIKLIRTKLLEMKANYDIV